MNFWLPIFAEGDAQAPPPQWMTFAPFIFMGLMLVMFWRTSSKQRRELQNSLAALKKNDRVVTSGGILGTVVTVNPTEDEVVLRVDDTTNTRIRVLKSSIVKISSEETAAAEPKT